MQTRKLLITILYLILIGVSLNYWGTVANAVVLFENGGIMPIVTGGEKNYILLNDGSRREFMEEGKLLFLADRFLIDFPVWENSIPDGMAGKAIQTWITYLDYPIEGGTNIVSAGDIMRWAGSALFLLLLPLLIFAIPLAVIASMSMGESWRGN
jgi:hypothetical protein